MKYVKAVFVGLVQGVTEFLPVSSSGHLTLLARLNVAPTSVFYNLALHLATLVAVLIVLRREVWQMIRHPVRGQAKYVLIASVPTVIVAFLFKKLCPSLLTGRLLGFGFLLTSVTLFALEKLCKAQGDKGIGVKTSLLTGLAQGVAALPGVSRSGLTIAAARFCGAEYDSAAKFSFLLSVPVILGGFLLEGAESGFSAAGADAGEIVVAALAALISGLFAATFMLKKTKKGLLPFALYTFLLGIACYFLP
ncbi:MAG TPA: undecaprenyl-diphosphatase [Clostridiales bacterium]|nr:undecaprenyl-diphosphatase [Clostridiales bacterium]